MINFPLIITKHVFIPTEHKDILLMMKCLRTKMTHKYRHHRKILCILRTHPDPLSENCPLNINTTQKMLNVLSLGGARELEVSLNEKRNIFSQDQKYLQIEQLMIS